MRSGCRLTLAFALSALFLACSGSPPEEQKPDAGDTTVLPDGGSLEPDAGLPPDAGSAPDAGSTPDGGTGPNKCSFDKFGNQLGWTCNRDADCKSGSCLSGLIELGMCTQECDEVTKPCPTGFSCFPFGANGEDVCISDDFAPTVAPAKSLKAGAPCSANSECAGDGAVCAGSDNGDGTYFTFCAPACAGNSCGECGSCEAFTTGSYCQPKGAGSIGQKCSSPLDCASFLCAGFCTDVCLYQGQTKKCPTGSSCEAINSSVSICVGAGQKGSVQEGGECFFDLECAGGNKCLPDPLTFQGVCTVPKAQGGECEDTSECAQGLRCVPDGAGGPDTCQPPRTMGGTCASTADCSTGLDCRDLSTSTAVCTKACGGGCGAGSSCVAPDLDTELRLFDHLTTATYEYLARNDDIDYASGNTWSEMVQDLPAGTYWVSVQTYKHFVADYKLELLTGSGAPVQLPELENPTRNDKMADATEIPSLPAEVAASIDSDADVDYFKFTLAQPARVTLRLSRGEPSICLPNALVAQKEVGEACSTNLACKSSLCEGRLKICGQACTEDSDCGASGLRCADFDTHKSCIPGALVGTKAADAKCDYSFECSDGYCANYKFNKFCTSRCETASCGATKECAALKVTRSGAPVTEQACVPQGNKSALYGASCTLQSDCQSGVCADGRCSLSCTSTTQCPGQNLQVPQGDVACQPCQTSAECGPGGRCLAGVGLERYCVKPCDPAGDKCDPGFRCEDNGFGTKLCKPEAGSCHLPVCDQPAAPQAGICKTPVSGYGELCAQANECTTQSCQDGLCSKSCNQNSDCGCATGDLLCKAGSCQLAPYEAETEPGNDSLAGAQPLTGSLPLTLFATTRPNGTRPDKDFFKVQLTGGKKVSIVTRPVCNTAAPGLDLAVTLLNAQGATLETDDLLDYYGSIVDFLVPSTGTYVIQVEDEAFTTPKVAGYVLEISQR